ncbi:MAG TPA: hypothetical protein DD643_07395 [Synechococcus sp. UBA8638]|nr:hypothetical protein [Synechococcus sp. UBA8638]
MVVIPQPLAISEEEREAESEGVFCGGSGGVAFLPLALHGEFPWRSFSRLLAIWRQGPEQTVGVAQCCRVSPPWMMMGLRRASMPDAGAPMVWPMARERPLKSALTPWAG